MSVARWHGLASIAGGSLLAAWGYLHKDARDLFLMRADAPLFLRLTAIAVPLLLLVALFGVYAQLDGEAGLLGKVGLILAVWGSVSGFVHGVADDHLLHRYFLERGWPGQFLAWLPPLLTGSILIGVAVMKTRALGRWSALPTLTGLSGWLYHLTDVGDATELRAMHAVFGVLSMHVVLGVLFSLCWIALGCVLGVGPGLSKEPSRR